MARKILLVDDSPAIRSLIKAYLSSDNLNCVEAETAERALHLVRIAHVDLVIIDINLPGMSGFDFTKALRESGRPELQKMPVVLMTGDKSEIIGKQATQSGATDFVRKPFGVDDIKRILRRYLPQETAK